jgi:hypothetical protein
MSHAWRCPQGLPHGLARDRVGSANWLDFRFLFAYDPWMNPPTSERTRANRLPSDAHGVVRSDGLLALDRRLATLGRARGPLRAVLARIACHLVAIRGWERIGYARLSDYAGERLGLSARWVRSLALVGEAFHAFPRLEESLAAGMLAWTKVRLLASLPRDEDEATWIARASQMTAEELSKTVRAVDRGSLECLSDDADEVSSRSRVFEVRCSPEVRWKWYAARGAASRAAGRTLPVAEVAELIAAEVLSSVPVDEQSDQDVCDEATASWTQPSELVKSSAVADGDDTRSAMRPGPPPASRAADPWRGYGELETLIVGLEHADAFELDDRLRRVLSMEQRLDARIGPLLVRIWDGWVHRALGYATREAYARERLGMDPTRARALVRLERAAALSEPFARAYRSGSLSAVKAGVLLPIVSSDPLGRFMEEWVAWAKRVTVRRLREDVEWALALEDTDAVAFRVSGGLPPDARRGVPDREIGAPRRDLATDTTPHLEPCSVRFFGPAEVVQLFRAVLCTVRRELERDGGRLPTEGQALGAMLDHVLGCWGALHAKVAARHRVFERDGWRCTVPGCTSMQNLHDHHIRFRSAGGSDEPANRVTLCAFHHLRGVHAARLRCVGTAPDGLTWQMGLRPGVAPLVAYRSGDVELMNV